MSGEMGIDFRIDDAPRYRLTGIVGTPDPAKSWAGDRFEGDVITGDVLLGLIENFEHEGPINLAIETVPQEPSLGEDAIKADRDSPSWAYSGFDRFRRRVAQTINVDLDMMENYGNEHTIVRRYCQDVLGQEQPILRDWDALKAAAFPWWEKTARWWKDIESDLVPLLNHSDCEDDLSPEDCGRVAPALRDALERMKEAPYDRFNDGHDYDVEKGYALARMMDLCAQYERRLVFC